MASCLGATCTAGRVLSTGCHLGVKSNAAERVLCPGKCGFPTDLRLAGWRCSGVSPSLCREFGLPRERMPVLVQDRRLGASVRSDGYLPGVPDSAPRMNSLLDRITVNPDQCGGRPCIRGMRMRVIDVLQLLAVGETPEQILADFPYLEREDISAALEYAARRLDHPTVAA